MLLQRRRRERLESKRHPFKKWRRRESEITNDCSRSVHALGLLLLLPFSCVCLVISSTTLKRGLLGISCKQGGKYLLIVPRLKQDGRYGRKAAFLATANVLSPQAWPFFLLLPPLEIRYVFLLYIFLSRRQERGESQKRAPRSLNAPFPCVSINTKTTLSPVQWLILREKKALNKADTARKKIHS